MRRTAWFVLACVVVVGVVSSLAQTQGGGGITSIQPIFDRECVKCHGPQAQKAKLDLSPEKAYTSLVNVPSRQVSTMVRVKPGDPDQSYLWLKLEHRSLEGDGMPKGLFSSKKLSRADLDAIKAWIAAGANP